MIITWNELMAAKKPLDDAWRLRSRLEERAFNVSSDERAVARLRRAIERVKRIEDVRSERYNKTRALWANKRPNATRQVAEVR